MPLLDTHLSMRSEKRGSLRSRASKPLSLHPIERKKVSRDTERVLWSSGFYRFFFAAKSGRRLKGLLLTSTTMNDKELVFIGRARESGCFQPHAQ